MGTRRTLLATAIATQVMAAIPATAQPLDGTRMVFEDDAIRVQEVTFKPGDQGPNIARPLRIIRVVRGGAMQRIDPDGKIQAVEYKTGEVRVDGPDPPFVPRNAGKSDIVLYVVAVKAPTTAAGWSTLLDGESGLGNWDRVGEANWRAQDGAIVADAGKGGFLVSKASYRDFHVIAEFWAEAGTNSGLFLRLSDPVRVTSRNAYEVNIFDESPQPAYGTGAIVNVAGVTAAPKAAGRWSTVEVIARGPHLQVLLNGSTTVDTLDASFERGPFALQYRGGPIKWRSVRVRELR